MIKIEGLVFNGLPMKLTIESKKRLNDGHEIPWLGLGVYQAPMGEETVNAVNFALKAGYRHIDTAKIYRNETDVGNAIRKSGISRDKIFVTTKLWNDDQGYDSALKACDESLNRLKFEYVDLYLIHWPLEPKKRKDSWRALIKLKELGLAKSIGVSNFTVRHLEELLQWSSVVPSVNQVEFSPFLFQKELLEFCKQNKIQLEAYSPLTQGQRLNDKNLLKVSQKHNKTPAQILIRWCLDHEVVVIPKSIREERIRENSLVFDFSLDKEDLKILDGVDEDYRVSWNPTNIR